MTRIRNLASEPSQTVSMRGWAESLGVNEPISLRFLCATRAIQNKYDQTGSNYGPMGSLWNRDSNALSQVFALADGSFQRESRGGVVRFQLTSDEVEAQAQVKEVVTLRLTGLRCVARFGDMSFDKHDEVFGLITVIPLARPNEARVIKFPTDKVEWSCKAGTECPHVVDLLTRISPEDFAIQVALWERDKGNVDEYIAKANENLEIIKKALPVFGNMISVASGAIDLAERAVHGIFGFGDDLIGTKAVTFNYWDWQKRGQDAMWGSIVYTPVENKNPIEFTEDGHYQVFFQLVNETITSPPHL